MDTNHIKPHSGVLSTTNPIDRVKQIQDLYRTQIKQIYMESKKKIQGADIKITNAEVHQEIGRDYIVKQFNRENSLQMIANENTKKSIKISNMPFLPQESVNSSINTEKIAENKSNSKAVALNSNQYQDRNNASMILRGQSSKTMAFLRQEVETKELKIRQLTNKCELLIEKLKKSMNEQDFQQQLLEIQESSDYKMERLERLFKIKNEQIFYKMKLQIVNLLDEFGIPKDDLNQANEIGNQRDMFIFMIKKLKSKLKYFKSKEQQSTFQLQKDKLINKKHQERISYLNQTVELLHLSQAKYKSKIEDLKGQMNIFIQKLKEKQFDNEKLQSQCFRFKKQIQESNNLNQRLLNKVKQVQNIKRQQISVLLAKQSEMKNLLNSYHRRIEKLEKQNEEVQFRIEQLLIKYRFLEQENQSVNREYIRWKQRYEWLQKQKQNSNKQSYENYKSLQASFQEYKSLYNQRIMSTIYAKLEELSKSRDNYVERTQHLQGTIQFQAKLYQQLQLKHRQQLSQLEKSNFNQLKSLEIRNQAEILELESNHSIRQRQIMEVFERKEALLVEEMEIRLSSLLNDRQKQYASALAALHNENLRLSGEIESLRRFLKVKEEFVNAVRQSSNKTQSPK